MRYASKGKRSVKLKLYIRPIDPTPVVVEGGDICFFEQGDNGGGPQAGWDSGLGE
jgi:hypothetical protein